MLLLVFDCPVCKKPQNIMSEPSKVSYDDSICKETYIDGTVICTDCEREFKVITVHGETLGFALERIK